MDIFKDLLENTQGFPADQRKDIQNTADTLLAIGALSEADLQESTQYIFDHLPELREERAQRMDREAAAEKDPQVRAQRKIEAAMLHKSAKKLADGPDEQFKRRAALVELSIHLKSRLREMAQANPEIDPVRLKKFKTALSVAASGGMDADQQDKLVPRVQRELAARLQFLQEFREAGGDVNIAVDNFYQHAFADRERGHWGDLGSTVAISEESPIEDSLDALKDLATQSPLEDLVDRQNAQERIAGNRLLQAMPKLAAEHLSPKEYAAYRTLIDNSHLLDWKIEGGKIHFKAKTLDAGDDSNTVGKILARELDYQKVRGANLLIQTTVDKLNGLLRENDGREVVLTEKGRQRMQKPTAEILADPAAKARPAPAAGQPRGGKRKGPEL